MLEELELCLEVASTSFDFSKVAYMEFFLDGLGDIAVQTVYFMSRQGKNVSTCRHADIDAALAHTTFQPDLNKVVSRYRLRVKSMNSTEEFILLSSADFLKKNLVSSSLKVPKEMIAVSIRADLASDN